MFDILCITNRKLCKKDFLKHIEEVATASPKAVILREKDLTEEEYRMLAKEVFDICRKYDVNCILHSFTEVAKELKCKAVHLPMSALRALSEAEKAWFTTLGASCHSIEEAKEAEKLGCTYITAGHIFETDCKKGLPGRGIDFLQKVCASVAIPVYAIGGISAENIGGVKNAGASGACVMSGIMTCENPEEYFATIKSICDAKSSRIISSAKGEYVGDEI